jgi:hypothetical protein
MDMTVRDLIRQLVEFNPDAKIDVDLGNGKPTSFSLAWGALDGEGMDKVKTSSVSIDVEDADNEPNCDQSTVVGQSDQFTPKQLYILAQKHSIQDFQKILKEAPSWKG